MTIQLLTVRAMASRAELGRLWAEVERTRDALASSPDNDESGHLAWMANMAEKEYQNAIESDWR